MTFLVIKKVKSYLHLFVKSETDHEWELSNMLNKYFLLKYGRINIISGKSYPFFYLYS